MDEICPVCEKEINPAYRDELDGVALHGQECFTMYQTNQDMYQDSIARHSEHNNQGAKELNAEKPKKYPEKIQEQEKLRLELSRQAEKIKLTTGFSFTHHQIEDELGIVTAECVYGMNIFRDMFVGLRDFFGGRSKASQNVLRDARNTCLTELKIEAHDLGADGVIGIDLDYSEISGGGKSGMLLLVASGTAVKFKNSRSIND